MNQSISLEETLAKLISFYPVTSNQASVNALLLYTKERLESTGNFKDCNILTNNGVHMLYASTSSTKKPKLLLQSHIDVVPAEPKQRIAETKNKKMFGRGTRDMLFAAASYITLACELEPDELRSLDFAILLSGDEEVGGANTIPYILKNGYSADVVLLPDAGNNLQEVVTQAKGVYNFDIQVSGIAHHGSRPWEGDNAALKLVHLLLELQQTFEKPTNGVSTCTIAELEAGDATNKGPASARAHVDIRYINIESLLKIKNDLQTLCQKYNATITNLSEADSYNIDIENSFISQYIDIAQKYTGKTVESVSVSGSSDARYFSAENIPVIMTRPLSSGSHSDEEWIDLNSFHDYYDILKQYTRKVAIIS